MHGRGRRRWSARCITLSFLASFSSMNFMSGDGHIYQLCPAFAAIDGAAHFLVLTIRTNNHKSSEPLPDVNRARVPYFISFPPCCEKDLFCWIFSASNNAVRARPRSPRESRCVARSMQVLGGLVIITCRDLQACLLLETIKFQTGERLQDGG